MKRKAVFSHRAVRMGPSLRGVFWSHGVPEFSCFCCHQPLPGLPNPPSLCVFCELFWHFLSSAIVLVVIFHCIKSQFLVSRILALLCCNTCDLRC